MAKHRYWGLTIRKISSVIWILSMVYIIFMNIAWDDKTFGWRFDFMPDSTLFTVNCTVIHLFVAIPLLALFLGISVTSVPTFHIAGSLKYRNLVCFILALPMIVLGTIASSYGIDYHFPGLNSLYYYLVENDWLRFFWWLVSGLLVGSGIRSLVQKTSK